MHPAIRSAVFLTVGIVLALAIAACGGSSPAPTPVPPPPAPNPFAAVAGIVDPDNHGWPREVDGLNGRITIAAKPLRIVTLSVGHDEMTYALVPAERVVAVGSATKNPSYSNVAHLARDLPTISREPEVILAQNPDIMVTSPFVKAEIVESLSNAGLTVVQTSLENDPQARINNILFLGYIYGEEARAVELAAEIRRLEREMIAAQVLATNELLRTDAEIIRAIRDQEAAYTDLASAMAILNDGTIDARDALVLFQLGMFDLGISILGIIATLGNIPGNIPVPIFHGGGIVPGPLGKPLLASVTGGEAILTSADFRALIAQLKGGGRNVVVNGYRRVIEIHG
ncbi:MAG: ABC transporter substrate-binding protein, partial [Chloroflexi bacterium]|nr:ABC transporter substrate-binding protein [Chloroflexota bacterium]